MSPAGDARRGRSRGDVFLRFGEQCAEGDGSGVVDYEEARGAAGRDNRRGERGREGECVYGAGNDGVSGLNT